MSMPLHEKIINDGKNEAKYYSDETLKLVSSFKEKHLTKIKNEYLEKVSKLKEENKLEVSNHLRKLNYDLSNYNEKVKNDLIVEIFNEIYDEVAKLEEVNLLNFIHSLLKDVNTKNIKYIVVSRANENKYLKALSSTNSKDNLDLLKKDYNFAFKTANLYFKNGFLLETNTFDLIFDFKEIISNYKTKFEKAVYKKLFEDE